MGSESVIEFLSSVSEAPRLLSQENRPARHRQTLLSVSIRSGECVVREAETGDRVYFEGEAEVIGSADDDERKSTRRLLDLILSNGFASIEHQVDVIGLSKALVAAMKTVDCLKLLHSVHAHFLLAGDSNTPIIYQAHRIRDGKSFATRTVDAIQKGINTLTLLVSFKRLDMPFKFVWIKVVPSAQGSRFTQSLEECMLKWQLLLQRYLLMKEEEGSVYQQATMPSVPVPDTLLSMEGLHEKRLLDPHLLRTYQIKAAAMKFVPWPTDIRFFLRFWFRAKGKLSDDQALHRCVVEWSNNVLNIQCFQTFSQDVVSPSG
ncbi:unnamed protein product [Malus baccata var. baccata]